MSVPSTIGASAIFILSLLYSSSKNSIAISLFKIELPISPKIRTPSSE